MRAEAVSLIDHECAYALFGMCVQMHAHGERQGKKAEIYGMIHMNIVYVRVGAMPVIQRRHKYGAYM